MKQRILLTLAAILLALPLLFFALAASRLGPPLAAALLHRLLPDRLSIGAATGSLLGSFSLRDVCYADGIDTVCIEELAATWNPSDLLSRGIVVETVTVSGLKILLGPGDDIPVDLPAFSLPVKLLISALRVERLTLSTTPGEFIPLPEIRASNLSFHGHTIGLESCHVSDAHLNLEASGHLETTEGYPLQLTFDVTYAPAGYAAMIGKGVLTGPLKTLALEASLSTPAELRLAGTLFDLVDTLRWQAELTGPHLSPAHFNRQWPDLHLDRLAMTTTGSLDAYHLEIAALAPLPRSDKPLTLKASLQGDGHGLRSDDLRLAHEKALLQLSGSLLWTPALIWELAAEGDGIDPAMAFPGWPGSLALSARSSGKMVAGRISASVDLSSLQGPLRAYPLKAAGKGEINGSQFTLPELTVTSGSSSLHLSGKGDGESMHLAFRLASEDLGTLWPDAAGRIEAQGSISGVPAAPDFEGKALGSDLVLAGTTLSRLVATAAGTAATDGKIEATIEAGGLAMTNDLTLETVGLRLNGTLEQHTLAIEGRHADFTSSFSLKGNLADSAWTGTVEGSRLTSLRFGDWQQEKPALFTLAKDRAGLHLFCLGLDASSRVCLDGSWQSSDGAWGVDGSFASIPLDLPPPSPLPLTGRLHGSFTLKGRDASLATGKLTLQGEGLSTRFELMDGTPQSLQWRENTFEAGYDGRTLKATLRSSLEDTSALDLDLELANLPIPGFSPEMVEIRGASRLSLKNLAPLTLLTDNTAFFTGRVQGEGSFAGQLLKPKIKGHLELLEGDVEIPQFGVHLAPVRLTFAGDLGRMHLQADARSGEGALRAEGTIDLTAIGHPPQLSISLSGENFTAAHLPGLELTVSPDLVATVGKSRIDLKGKMHIPTAHITTIDFGSAVSSSSDILVIDGENHSSAATSRPLFTAVTMEAGEQVLVDAYGLKGRIIGKLQVSGQPNRPLVGNGTLAVRDGSFTLYGKQLKIDTGQLLFSGGPLTNPGLNLRSEVRRDNITAGVTVAGFMQRPEITFYSHPHMEQYAIVSQLLTDTPIGGATRDDIGFLGEAAEKTGLGGLVPLLRGVKQLSGVDEIKIERGRRMDSTSLILGRWITPDFYISYGKNLFRESGSFNTRFALGKGFYLKTETGPTQSSGDIKYEFSR